MFFNDSFTCNGYVVSNETGRLSWSAGKNLATGIIGLIPTFTKRDSGKQTFVRIFALHISGIETQSVTATPICSI
jgi:hypothetical protein